ncbi:MAG: hypothetical protein NXI09_15795 [Bacteroidetes bacterium]|nr:hypothetical protein [Bacteroidota bacterium]
MYYNKCSGSVPFEERASAKKPQTDIDEIWTFKSQATIGDQLFDLVFYRNALGNLNFDRGFEWIVSASDGYVAYVESLPLRFDHPGDTLFLIEHY